MTPLLPSVVEAIGATPLVELAPDSAAVGLEGRPRQARPPQPRLLKKDRAARRIVEDARASGELAPGQTVVELTSGNMGTGLAIVCAVLGHPFVAVMSAATPRARPDDARARRRGRARAAIPRRLSRPGLRRRSRAGRSEARRQTAGPRRLPRRPVPLRRRPRRPRRRPPPKSGSSPGRRDRLRRLRRLGRHARRRRALPRAEGRPLLGRRARGRRRLSAATLATRPPDTGRRLPDGRPRHLAATALAGRPHRHRRRGAEAARLLARTKASSPAIARADLAAAAPPAPGPREGRPSPSSSPTAA